MSGQRSDWRERLRVNPSRMEEELVSNYKKTEYPFFAERLQRCNHESAERMMLNTIPATTAIEIPSAHRAYQGILVFAMLIFESEKIFEDSPDATAPITRKTIRAAIVYPPKGWLTCDAKY